MRSFIKFETYELKKKLHVRPVYSLPADDIMFRGSELYGFFDEASSMWNTSESALIEHIDGKLANYIDSNYTSDGHGGYFSEDIRVVADYVGISTTGELHKLKVWLSDVPRDYNYHQLDERLTFPNDSVSYKDRRSKRLGYSPTIGPTPFYDRFMSTCYDPANREKLEWAVGSILCGDSTKLQKFIALYGKPGTGKSTFLNIVQKIFDGYWDIIDVDALVSKTNQFGTALLRNAPLVCIQHEADLSRIDKNDVLNALVSHERLVINEKNVKQYSIKSNAMIFLGTNEFVNISESRQGISRRMIDVYPTGDTLPLDIYDDTVAGMDFEIPAIAKRCMDVYLAVQNKEPTKYIKYRPADMIKKTNVYFNFVSDKYFELSNEMNDPIGLGELYRMFKEYMLESGFQKVPIMSKFKENILEFYDGLDERGRIDGRQFRNVLHGFKKDYVLTYSDNTLHVPSVVSKEPDGGLNANEVVVPKTLDSKFKMEEWHEGMPNVLNDILADCPAQYSNAVGIPSKAWDDCKTTLKDLRTSREHYVRAPVTLICVDFDLKGPDGQKSLERNLEAAEVWPLTYCETSKSGKGLHLYYWYHGNPDEVSRIFKEDIEIKIFTGKSSLRRKLKWCNAEEVATIETGLPLREAKKVVNFNTISSEQKLREYIIRNLKKEFHGYTKPSIDFIKKLLDDAYASGMHYDVSDLQHDILVFANNSTHNSAMCVKAVSKMHFKSDEPDVSVLSSATKLTYFDVEVFPNVLIVCYKEEDEDDQVKPCHRMFNPSISAIEQLFKCKLVGYNNRKYDNHILYARYMGYDNLGIYRLSQKLTSNDQKAQLAASFSEAYNISEMDVFDILATKQTLKKWEIQLGIHHQENQYPWDQPLPEDKWEEVADYCCNDVRATEAVLKSKDGKADLMAREILAELSGLTLNNTTRQHVTKIIFGDDKHPELVYTDLSKEFPGYEFTQKGFIDPSRYDGYDPNDKSTWKTKSHSIYLGQDPSEGGYVAYKDGVWLMVGLLDAESLHPHSAKELNIFGKYTKRYVDILNARLAIKHGDIETAKTLFDGRLAKYLTDAEATKRLAYALKIVINSVYGYTSATFENPFRDPRNVDNIVAKRGALFMILLTKTLNEKKIPWVHVKTDSIKIPNITPEIVTFVQEFGKKYGYTFEHESTYREMCLINGSTYVAKCESGKHAGEWVCVAAQFQHPYVKKALFTKEDILFEDLCEVKEVKTSMTLDFNENLGEGEHKYQFVGRIGNFIPVKEGFGGGVLLRDKGAQYDKDKAAYENKLAEIDAMPDGSKEKTAALKKLTVPSMYTSVTGTVGYRWLDAETLKGRPFDEVKQMIDFTYFRKLCDDAKDAIAKYVDPDIFIQYGNASEEQLASLEFPLDDDALPF